MTKKKTFVVEESAEFRQLKLPGIYADDNKLNQLINDHWKFLQKVINLHDSSIDKGKKLKYAEFYFKEGMRHGYKHGKEGR